MLPLIIMVVVGIAVGIAFLSYRHRPEHSIESGISSFRREMSALAPPGDPRRRPQPDDEPPTPQPQRVDRPVADADDEPPPGPDGHR